MTLKTQKQNGKLHTGPYNDYLVNGLGQMETTNAFLDSRLQLLPHHGL